MLELPLPGEPEPEPSARLSWPFWALSPASRGPSLVPGSDALALVFRQAGGTRRVVALIGRKLRLSCHPLPRSAPRRAA